jgi:hypothetical protein
LSRLFGFVREAFAPLVKLTEVVVREMLGPCSPIGVEDRLRRDRQGFGAGGAIPYSARYTFAAAWQ